MVDKIAVRIINLDRSPERWEILQKWNHGFTDFKRFSAMDAKKLDYMNDDRISLRTKMYVKANVKRAYYDINSAGALGCSISWHTILKEFYDDKNGREYLIVFEDDLDTNKMKKNKPYAEQVLEEFEKIKDKNWDLWLLGRHSYVGGVSIGQDTVEWKDDELPKIDITQKITNPFSFNYFESTELLRVKAFLGTHAIMIKRESIPKILKDFFPIDMHIDCYLSFLAQKADIQIIYNPRFNVEQNGSCVGTIDHEIWTVAILSQTDVWYKFICYFVLLLAIIFLLLYYFKASNKDCVHNLTGFLRPSSINGYCFKNG